MKLQPCCLAFPLLLLGPPCLSLSPAEAAGVPTLNDLQELGTATTAPLMVVPQQVAQDIQYLEPRILEVSRVRGVKRTFLGLVLLAALLAHLYFETYPELMPTHHKAFHRAKQFKEMILNEEETSKAEYVVERYLKYANEHPEVAAAQGAALFFGLVFFLSGIVALSRPRRVKQLVPVLPYPVAKP